MSELKAYSVWDRTTRIFHWINAICFTLMVILGISILNANAVGASDEGKVLLKSLHASVGYVLVINLLWRLIWAFIGGRHARWSAILPLGKGYFTSLKAYISAFFSTSPQHYLGHNPAGRIAVTLLLALLTVQAATGLMLAGTDIFFPPFGGWIQEWIAPAGVDPASLLPGARDTYDATAYEEMRAFRAPFIEVHVFNFYVLVILALLHIIAVVVTEIREGSGLISAMFSGKKFIDGTPVDAGDDSGKS